MKRDVEIDWQRVEDELSEWWDEAAFQQAKQWRAGQPKPPPAPSWGEISEKYRELVEKHARARPKRSRGEVAA